jgi:hypothetical protein
MTFDAGDRWIQGGVLSMVIPPLSLLPMVPSSAVSYLIFFYDFA